MKNTYFTIAIVALLTVIVVLLIEYLWDNQNRVEKQLLTLRGPESSVINHFLVTPSPPNMKSILISE